MHASIAEILYGEHLPAFSRSGMILEKFAELDTPKRHAIAFVVSTSHQPHRNLYVRAVAKEINRLGDLIAAKSIFSEKHKIANSLFEKIVEPNLWSRQAYRGLSRIIQDTESVKTLRHLPEISEQIVRTLGILPTTLRTITMVKLCKDTKEASAVAELFQETTRVVPKNSHQNLIASLRTSPSLDDFSNRCRTQIFKCMPVSDQLPDSTRHFRRIRTLSDCHRVAQSGHCFNEEFMLDEVFKGDVAFFEWSGARNAVVELQRDNFPFGWSVRNAMKPKSTPLTKLQKRQLAKDLVELGANVRLSSPSTRFEKLLS